MLLQYWPNRTNVRFMSFRLPALLFSAILIAASFALIFTKGLNFGIDFAGHRPVGWTDFDFWLRLLNLLPDTPSAHLE